VNELKWLIIILIILLFLFILIIFSKITIYLKYYHHKDDDDLKIEVRLWFGLIRFKKQIPLIKVDNNSPSVILKGTGKSNEETQNNEEIKKITPQKLINSLKNFKEILEHVFQLNSIIKNFLKKVSIQKFEWQTAIGVGDAVYTGVAAGALWSIKGAIVGLLSNYLSMKEMPKLMVHPNFQQMITSTDLSCMFQFRIGHAMLAGLKLVKWWKGGLPHLKPNNIMTS
jgi:energy-coupling factor transporter transmembrane protein EcfT